MLIARTCAEGEAAHGTKVAAQLSLIGGQPGLSRWPSVSTGVLIRGRQGSGVRVPGMRVRRSPSQCCPLWGWKGPEPGDAGSCGSWRTGCCPGASGKGSRQANRVLQPREARFRLGTSRTVRQWVCVAASRGVCGLLSREEGGGWRRARCGLGLETCIAPHEGRSWWSSPRVLRRAGSPHLQLLSVGPSGAAGGRLWQFRSLPRSGRLPPRLPRAEFSAFATFALIPASPQSCARPSAWLPGSLYPSTPGVDPTPPSSPAGTAASGCGVL